MIELLCCALVVSVAAFCVVEAAGTSVRLSDGVRRRGARSADLRSIIGETARAAESGGGKRGELTASVARVGHVSGMDRADVSVSPALGGAEVLMWRSWDIEGRRR